MNPDRKAPLLIDRVDPDPFRQFSRWFAEAEQVELPMPNAMTLATATAGGKPSARIVLLKGVDEQGFVFYTHYESRKASELRQNSAAALVFYWRTLARQVRIEGSVAEIDPAGSDRYFASRPRGNQIEAHASPQSQVIADREFLESRFADLEEKFTGQQIPRPQRWGGYRLVPTVLEFWQEGAHRLHDRLRYRRGDDEGWVIERLAP